MIHTDGTATIASQGVKPGDAIERLLNQEDEGDVRVVWKDEGEVDGEPVGPVTIVRGGESTIRRLVPGERSRPRPRWVTLREARAIAAEHGVELEEV